MGFGHAATRRDTETFGQFGCVAANDPADGLRNAQWRRQRGARSSADLRKGSVHLFRALAHLRSVPTSFR